MHSATENSRGGAKQAYMLQSITVKLLAGLMSQHSELQNKGKSRELIKTTLSRRKRKMIWNIHWSQKHSQLFEKSAFLLVDGARLLQCNVCETESCVHAGARIPEYKTKHCDLAYCFVKSCFEAFILYRTVIHKIIL